MADLGGPANLTYMAADGNVYTPEFLAAHIKVQKIKRTEGVR